MKNKNIIFYTHLAQRIGVISPQEKEEIVKKNGFIYKKDRIS